jgi:hypothetical protein
MPDSATALLATHLLSIGQRDTLEVLEFAGRLLAEVPTNLLALLVDSAGRFLAQRVPMSQHLSLREGSGSSAPGRACGTKSELVALLSMGWQQREG